MILDKVEDDRHATNDTQQKVCNDQCNVNTDYLDIKCASVCDDR